MKVQIAVFPYIAPNRQTRSQWLLSYFKHFSKQIRYYSAVGFICLLALCTNPSHAAPHEVHELPQATIEQLYTLEHDVWRLPVPNSRTTIHPKLFNHDDRKLFDILLYWQHHHRMDHLEEEPVCDPTKFGTLTGSSLVDFIRTSTKSCINNLFSDTSARYSAFSKSNILSVGAATEILAEQYDGTGHSNLWKLLLFLRAGFFVQFFESMHLDWSLPDEEVTEQMIELLDTLVSNDHYFDVSDSNAEVLYESANLIDGTTLTIRYLPPMRKWLSLWNQQNSAIGRLAAGINSIFYALFRMHNWEDKEEKMKNDHNLITQLRDIALDDWMLNTKFDYIAENAAGELGRFLQYPDAPIHATVIDSVEAIFAAYKLDGHGKGIWIAMASSVNAHGNCERFGICNFEVELEKEILSVNHVCSDSVKIRSQDLTMDDLTHACNLLAVQGQAFHHRMRTAERPVADDHNTALEIIVFADSTNYKTYSPLFFGNDTNNGGIYLEGEPSQSGNQARFIAYVATWLPTQPLKVVWNLEHEYVHYLDGRFNLYGPFYALLVGTHHTVWWLEGFAEYMSLFNHNEAAYELSKQGNLKLSEIFPVLYSDGTEKVYRWSYLAVRFMFEKHRDLVDQMLRYFEKGDFDGYLNFIQTEIGSRFDSQWEDWLRELTDGGEARGLVELPRVLSMDEGTTSTYPLALASQPSQTVTVDISSKLDVVIEPEKVAFTRQNWDEPVTISVTSPTDSNAQSETGDILHTASGTGNYDDIKALMLLSVVDDAPTISFDEPSVTAGEGQVAVVSVNVEKAPVSRVRLNYELLQDDDPATFDADLNDFRATSGELTLGAGQTTANILLSIIDDSDIEPANEVIKVAFHPLTSQMTNFRPAGITESTVVIKEGVCDRSESVRERLRMSKPCEDVTVADLAAPHYISFDAQPISPLKPLDFQGLTRVVDLRLYASNIESLPSLLFHDMPRLRRIALNANRLTQLPGDLFRHNVKLKDMWAHENLLERLPEGLFVGLTDLQLGHFHDNPESPFVLQPELEQLGSRTFMVNIREGAPFDMTMDIQATGGSLSTESVTIKQGSTSSERIFVSPANKENVEVSIQSISDVPDTECHGGPCFYGLRTAIGTPLSVELQPQVATSLPTHLNVPAGLGSRIQLAELFPDFEDTTTNYAVFVNDASLIQARTERGSLLLSPSTSGTGVISITASSAGRTATIDLVVDIQQPHLTSISDFPADMATSGNQGFLRIVNNGDASLIGIEVQKLDGHPVGSLTAVVSERGSMSVSTGDLLGANSNIPLFGDVTEGSPAWRLQITRSAAIEVLAYVKHADGLLTNLHDSVSKNDASYHIPLFFSSNHQEQENRLHVINPNSEGTYVRIYGKNRVGASRGPIDLRLAANESRILDVEALETGSPSDLQGSLGEGVGNWSLELTSDLELQVHNLVHNSTGHLTNISSDTHELDDGEHIVPYFPSTTMKGISGILNIYNLADEDGTVQITAVDETGQSFGPLTLEIQGMHAVSLNSNDLQTGNQAKQLTGSLGLGQGDWYLKLTYDVNLNALAYIQSDDGYFASIHDTVTNDDNTFLIDLFPAGDEDEVVAYLRLINTTTDSASVTIRGVNDLGNVTEPIEMQLLAGHTQSLTAAALERGHDSLTGSFSASEENWRLIIEADEPITVMNLLETSTGYKSNLSSEP